MRIAFKTYDEYQEQKRFCSQLVSFAKEYNCHIHLVCHPRKSLRDSYKPGKMDVSGTANITNLAHNVLLLWRPETEFKEKLKSQGKDVADCVLFLKKNRQLGREDSIKFSFNTDTKRFIEKGKSAEQMAEPKMKWK